MIIPNELRDRLAKQKETCKALIVLGNTELYAKELVVLREIIKECESFYEVRKIELHEDEGAMPDENAEFIRRAMEKKRAARLSVRNADTETPGKWTLKSV